MDYKIINQSGVVVTTINGSITRDDLDALVKCREELLRLTPRAVILNFRDTETIELGTFRELTLLQHEIRKQDAVIHILGLSLKMKNLLGEKGVIRGSEVGNTLREVLSQYHK